MAVSTLRAEVADLLSRLIRVDTTNPPGNETAAAELLRDYLEANGVECELYARVPERANLVARLRGRGDGPSLLLLGHTDVVLADARDWSVPPFSGEVRDGEVWGRGALDMKSQVAAGRACYCSRTPTSCLRTRPNGTPIRSGASCAATRCGGAARST